MRERGREGGQTQCRFCEALRVLAASSCWLSEATQAIQMIRARPRTSWSPTQRRPESPSRRPLCHPPHGGGFSLSRPQPASSAGGCRLKSGPSCRPPASRSTPRQRGAGSNCTRPGWREANAVGCVLRDGPAARSRGAGPPAPQEREHPPGESGVRARRCHEK
jgi:hypothetical protein